MESRAASPEGLRGSGAASAGGKPPKTDEEEEVGIPEPVGAGEGLDQSAGAGAAGSCAPVSSLFKGVCARAEGREPGASPPWGAWEGVTSAPPRGPT